MDPRIQEHEAELAEQDARIEASIPGWFILTDGTEQLGTPKKVETLEQFVQMQETAEISSGSNAWWEPLHPGHDRVHAALGVLVLDPKLARMIKTRDPMAWRQACNAWKLAENEDLEAKLVENEARAEQRELDERENLLAEEIEQELHPDDPKDTEDMMAAIKDNFSPKAVVAMACFLDIAKTDDSAVNAEITWMKTSLVQLIGVKEYNRALEELGL